MAPPGSNLIIVNPQTYYHAATTLTTLADEMHTAATTLTATMPTTTQIGGNYTAADGWNRAYTTLTNDMRTAIIAHTGALTHFSDILNACGYNWDTAEYKANADPNKGSPPPTPQLGAANPIGPDSLPPVPTNPGFPGTGLTMRGNPGGDTWDAAPNASATALDTAATAWRTFADNHDLSTAPTDLQQVHDSFDTIQAPEVTDIQAILANLRASSIGIQHGADILASALRDHASKIITARSQLIDAAPDAFPKHAGQVSATSDDTSVTVTVNNEITDTDLNYAYTAFQNTANTTDLFSYLSHCTTGRDTFTTAASAGIDPRANLPKLKEINELGPVIESGDPTDNTALDTELANLGTWTTPAAHMTPADLSKLGNLDPRMQTWIAAAVKYGNQAGVDPRLVMAIVLNEGATRTLNNQGAPYDYGIRLPGELLRDDSLGLTNMKRATFNDVKNNHPDQFGNDDWSDLAASNDLAIKATAYKLKDIQDTYVNGKPENSAPTQLRNQSTLNEYLAASYNAGNDATLGYNNSQHIGDKGDQYAKRMDAHYQQADQMISGSGAYLCN